MRHLEIVVVESSTRTLLRSLAWRVPVCLVLTEAAHYLIGMATEVAPDHAKLITGSLTVATASIVAFVFVRSFISNRRR